MISRGDLWWAELPEPAGAGPGYRRPVLIIQSNHFNRSHIETVIAAPITSNLHLAEAPGNVLLSKRESGLPKESVVNVSQVITLDKHFLGERIHSLSAQVMRKVEVGLRLVMSL